MEVLTLVAIQCVALLAVIELFIWFMPTALKRASEQNCYRVDGTRSEHRTYRERRGRNRLRRDMLAVLILVFLTGNALYFTLDRDNSLRNLASSIWDRAVGSTDALNIAIHDQYSKSEDQKASGPVFSDKRWLLLVIGSWSLVSFLFVGWGAMRAYRTFAEGVNARGAEHFHLDMTRMSITDSHLVAEVARKDSSQGVA